MSGRCKGLHCDGCGRGGGVGAVIALLVIIAVGLRAAWPQIVHAVEIAAWTVAGVTGAAIVITGTVLTTRVARRVRARRVIRQATCHATVIPAARLIERPAIARPAGRPAIGEARPRRPARLYGPGCCEHWTPERGCSAGHTGRPALPLPARGEQAARRGQR